MTKKMYKDSLGGRIKKFREDRGLSQDELAELLGSSKSAISQYENDKIDMKYSVLSAIAEILEVRIIELLEEPARLKNDEIELLVQYRKIKDEKGKKVAYKMLRLLNDL